MSATPALTTDLQKQVLLLEEDLRARVEGDAVRKNAWSSEHHEAVGRGRTAQDWGTWRDDRVTQAAVGWVLATVFVRFCEDNALVTPVWIVGPAERRQEALDAQMAYFRREPEHTDREWLQQATGHLAALPATAELVGRFSTLHLVSPSGQAAEQLLTFWRRRDDDGALVHDLSDPSLDTRFLGDLYQDLSAYAKATFALLQTPVFVEEFILDRTLEPALADRPLAGFRMIDPTCGSGHFLLGAFDRLLDRWQKAEPGTEVQVLVQQALDAVHGVDLNPFAVAIARFRLTIAALRACGLRSLEGAPAFRFHVQAGDSLLHGRHQLELDLGVTADLEESVGGFAYGTEDLAVLRTILQPGRYDVVVGNPPYITVKDKTLNAAYRERYDACKGTYALTVPFMQRFFELARASDGEQPAGWVGQITSNSFMKREFGSKLIESFLAVKDLRLVADTSGAYIPGHGTPTVILVGRNQRPVGSTVRAVLGVRGEPGRPDEPSKGLVWRAIVEHVDESGWDDGWVTVSELDRRVLAGHPWSLSGGGAQALLERVRSVTTPLAEYADSGFRAITGSDDVFVQPRAKLARLGVASREYATGDSLRDYQLRGETVVYPYAAGRPSPSESLLKLFWPWRANLQDRRRFGTRMADKVGVEWWELRENYPKRFAVPRVLVFAFVATHNHFVLEREGSVTNRHAPVVQLRAGATEDEHLAFLGVLNSSTACFWLKQHSHNKGNGGIGGGIGDEDWEPRYEFTGTTLQDYPLPGVLPLERGRLLDSLAQQLSAQSPEAVAVREVPTAEVLAATRAESGRLRGLMISAQEELDWEVYWLYGLVSEDLTYAQDVPGLALGERAFEVVLARAVEAGEEETAWFSRHGSTPITALPEHWEQGYRDLIQQRLDLIASDPAIALLEKPEHKRRWAGESWDKRQERALRGWLLDRLDDRKLWFDGQGRPTPRSVASLADVVERDADLRSVLALWEGRPDVSVFASLTRLLADEGVPYLAAWRYKDTGLRKRAAWEATWALQRQEDLGVDVGVIPVPPKYTSADFRPGVWAHRGKLDVPKERFVSYPGAGRAGEVLLGWAGWDHAQQSLALSRLIGERESDGWSDLLLVPLVAGLAELQPWVEQWHGEVDPTYGVSMAAFCGEQLASRCVQVGVSVEDLGDWRPPVLVRGRKVRA